MNDDLDARIAEAVDADTPRPPTYEQYVDLRARITALSRQLDFTVKFLADNPVTREAFLKHFEQLMGGEPIIGGDREAIQRLRRIGFGL